ncbi:MAG: transposase, partial [bacterium]|nr:transposase [bacterium]
MAKHLPGQKKYKLLEKVLKDKQSVLSVCRHAGISRTIFYRWKKEFQGHPDKFLDRKRRFWRQAPPEKEKLVLETVSKHPDYSSHKISQALGINHKGKLVLGNHGVQNVLRRLDLSTYKKRLAWKKNRLAIEKKPLWFERKKLSAQKRLEIIKKAVDGGEKVAVLCREFGISRVIFYRWKKRYLEGPKGLELQTLADKVRQVKRYWRQVESHVEQKILDLVLAHPEWSVPKLAVVIRQAQDVKEAGIKAPGYYGVQRVLERNNLNTYQRRLTYRESLRPTMAPQPTPIPAPVALGKPKIWRMLKAPFVTVPKLVTSLRSLLLVLFLTASSFFVFYRWILMLAHAAPGTQAGLIFATISLSFGAFFFIYSIKYYFTLILILGFSRQVSGPSVDTTSEVSPSEFSGGPSTSEVKKSTGSGFKGILERIFGPSAGSGLKGNGNGYKNGSGNGNGSGRTNLGIKGGLQPDLSQVKLERQPFVSIHLALYNEKRVVERLLTACTGMEYENPACRQAGYEIVVVDDSTDETTETLRSFLKRGQGETREIQENGMEKIVFTPRTPASPRITVIHRQSRAGYKGGALKVALENTDPRAEFVTIFDADFLPYPDTITQFLKYFQVTAGGLDFRKASSREPLAASFKKEIQLAANSPEASDSPIAAVQGYQWHVLNKSENWITRGVRSEYAGSYVIERSGAEALGGLKQIAG